MEVKIMDNDHPRAKLILETIKYFKSLPAFEANEEADKMLAHRNNEMRKARTLITGKNNVIT